MGDIVSTLFLGVMDLPYADGASYREAGRRKPKQMGSSTTGDVAAILEEKYHIMEVFFELHGDEIAEDLVNSLAGAIENIDMGAPTSIDALGEAGSKIEERFRDFLMKKEMESLGIPGVPTQASLEGHSKRFKHPYAKRAPRPSFIDTGLFEGSFKAWVD